MTEEKTLCKDCIYRRNCPYSGGNYVYCKDYEKEQYREISDIFK